MNNAQAEIATVYNTLSRDNDPSLSASLVYDPNVTGFRIMTTTDYVNLNVTGAPILQVLYPTSTGISNFTPLFTSTTGIILQANSTRRGFYVQNLGATNSYLLFNTGICGPNNFNVMLTPTGTATSVWEDSYIRYTGQVTASGNPLNVIAWNF